MRLCPTLAAATLAFALGSWGMFTPGDLGNKRNSPVRIRRRPDDIGDLIKQGLGNDKQPASLAAMTQQPSHPTSVVGDVGSILNQEQSSSNQPSHPTSVAGDIGNILNPAQSDSKQLAITDMTKQPRPTTGPGGIGDMTWQAPPNPSTMTYIPHMGDMIHNGNDENCWLTKNCQSPGAVDTRNDSVWRWNNLCSTQAFNAAVNNYRKKDRAQKEGFPRSISNFFHGPSSMDCDVVAEANGCRSYTQCIMGADTGPAATFILNSFVALSNMFINMYEGVQDGVEYLEADGVLKNFVSTFAPDATGLLALKVIFDIVSFGLSLAAGPFFNNWLKYTSWGEAHGDTSDNLKAATAAVITFGFIMAKDNMNATAASDSDVSSQLLMIAREFKYAITMVGAQAFNGSNAGITFLNKTISDGKLMDAKPTGKLDMEDRMTRMFYALLIPYLWRRKGYTPVLLDTKTSCDSTAEIDIITKDNTKVCVDGQRYYLAQTGGGDAMYCDNEVEARVRSCDWNSLTDMPGYDQLTDGHWSGLKREDIAASIVNRQNIGWPNPSEAAKFPELNDTKNFDQIWDYINKDTVISAPGVIDIPICGVDEVKNNWKHTDNNYYAWPCNKP